MIFDLIQGVADFQTEADRKSQRMIVSSLSTKFPKLTIVGEEVISTEKCGCIEDMAFVSIN